MTKIYVVMLHDYKTNESCVSNVFTNKKLANNYKNWMQKTLGTIDKIYYTLKYDICRADYGKIPY